MANNRSKRVKKNQSTIKIKLLFLAGLLIVATGLYLFENRIRSVIETQHSVTKEIPSDVKGNLDPNYRPFYRVPILLYHYVEHVADKNDSIRQSLDIEPSTFEMQVKTLSENGYTFMTASELGEVLDGKRRLPKKPVLLTFDDGHWDVDTVVLPILKKYHAKATAYIITGYINGSDFLTDKQIKELVDSGLVELGAHTVHHISLKNKLLPIVEYEVKQSKHQLESAYGIKVNSFAYPDGAFDQQAIDVVKSAGYTTAVTTIPGLVQTSQNKYFLLRLRPGYREGKDLIDYFNKTGFKPY